MRKETPTPTGSNAPFPLWVIGLAASGGGITALGEVLSALPPDLPAAVLIVQHTTPRPVSLLARVLSHHTQLKVQMAKDGDRLRPGTVFVAVPDRHLVVNPDGTLSLTGSARVCHVRPSADVLFASMALNCKERSIAVVLTGGDDDGATGVKLVKAMGGTVIAQDEPSCEHFAMPRAAIATGAVDYVLPLRQIPTLLGYLVSREPGENGQRGETPRNHCSAGHCEGGGPNGKHSKPRAKRKVRK